MRLTILVLLMAISVGCANPNRRNGLEYNWCELIDLMEVHKLGIRDCHDGKDASR